MCLDISKCVRLWLSCNLYVPFVFEPFCSSSFFVVLLVFSQIFTRSRTQFSFSVEGSIWLMCVCVSVCLLRKYVPMFDIRCIAIRFQTVARNSILRFQWLRHWNSHYRFASFFFAVVVVVDGRQTKRTTQALFSLKIRVLLNNIKSITGGKVSESKRACCIRLCLCVCLF